MTADPETTPRSLTGARWLEAPHDARLAAGMVDATGMPQAVANMLAGRASPVRMSPHGLIRNCVT